jgi:hypothetical protein
MKELTKLLVQIRVREYHHRWKSRCRHGRSFLKDAGRRKTRRDKWAGTLIDIGASETARS